MKIKLLPQNEKQFHFVLNFLKDLIDRELYVDELLISLMFHKGFMYIVVSQHSDMAEMFEDELFTKLSKHIHYSYKVPIEITPNEKFNPYLDLESHSDFVIFSPNDTESQLITFVQMLDHGSLECEHLEEFSPHSGRLISDAPACLPLKLSTDVASLELVWIQSSFVPISHILGVVDSRYLYPISMDALIEVSNILKVAFQFRSLEQHRDQLNAILLSKSESQNCFVVFGASHKALVQSSPSMSAEFFTMLSTYATDDACYMLSSEIVGLLLEMLKDAENSESSFGYQVPSNIEIDFVGKKNPFRILGQSSFGFGFRFGQFYMRVKPLALTKTQNSPIKMYEKAEITYKYQVFKKLSSRLISRFSQIFSISDVFWDQAKITIFDSAKPNYFGIYVHGYDLFGSPIKQGFILPFSKSADIEFLRWCVGKTFELAQVSQAIFDQECQISFLISEKELVLKLEFTQADPNPEKSGVKLVYAVGLCAVQISDQ